MKIYTKTGDKGETGLFGGKRVKKYDLRIQSYGTIDELNSWIGLLRDLEIHSEHKLMLLEIQDRLFTIGSELAADPDKPKLKKPDLFEHDIQKLEEEIDKLELKLNPMTQFVLPGGHQFVSFVHITRTVCRRAERLVIELREQSEIHEYIIPYLNRLSDYLFVLSRSISKETNAVETNWIPRI